MMKKKKQAIATIYFTEKILENIFVRLPRRSLMRFKCVSKYFCALFGKKMMKKKKQAIATIYFTEEILENIFVRLPRRSLMRFKCVSKYFCTLFGSRDFQSMHHELSKIRNNTNLTVCDDSRKKLCMIDYKSVSSLLPLSTSSATTCEEFGYRSISLDCCKVECLSSCDGLVWMHLYKVGPEESGYSLSQEYCIWNPATNGHERIPMVPGVNTMGISGYGFCYDYKTNDYKLVAVVANWRVSKLKSKCSDVHVYTLGSNSWETIQSMPYYPHYTHRSQSKEGVLFNGALHWLVRTFGGKSTILERIDVVNKIIQELALPELPMLPEPDMSVGVLGGFLCLITRVSGLVDVWIMQDYGAKESWAKSFSITEENIISTGMCLNLVWSFKNNETLWKVKHGLVLYDPNNKTCKQLYVGLINLSMHNY